MNELQKNDFVYFKNEILKDMKQIETKFTEKVVNLCEVIKKTSMETDEKIDAINIKIKKLLDNDTTLLEEKINSKIEKNKNHFEEKITDLGTKINMVKKDLSNACFKYDKIVLDNLKVTGIIGEGCTYNNLKLYIEFLNKKLSDLSTSKDKTINEIKIIKSKINDIASQFNSDFENHRIILNDMISIRLNEGEKKNLEQVYGIEKQIENLRLENYNFSSNLIKKTEELNIEYDKLENIKKEIYDKFEEEKTDFQRYIDNLTNTFNSQKKEFNLIKTRFTDLSNVLKHMSSMKFSSGREGNFDSEAKNNKKEILKLVKRMNFNRKQSLSKEDLELINNEEKNNVIKPDDEDKSKSNIINEQEIKHKKNNKIILSDNLKRDDSNYINNINLKENLLENSPEKETGEKESELNLGDININKNTRKNALNINDSNSIEKQNRYTKITIKSLNKKTQEDENENNDRNKDMDIEKNKNEITLENTLKFDEKNEFAKTINKNIFLNLKKSNKSIKKINFNKSHEKRNQQENVLLTKSNIRKKLLKSENDKIHEFLSLSNDLKSFNSQTNTGPFNLKLQNLYNKKETKNNEEILPLYLESHLLNGNNEKENKFFKMIIQYIKLNNHNINDRFQNISFRIGNDIYKMKKEINQIYNDVNMITLNNNQNLGRMAPFRVKINNYDLNNNSSFQLNMENFKYLSKINSTKNKSIDKIFNYENQDTPRNVLNSIEPFLIKKFKEKVF